MKIAQVSPLYESVPPRLYGGTERVVHNITEELVQRGHEVTLFASGDSITNAKLISPCKRSLRMDDSCIDPYSTHVKMIEMVEKESYKFDIIHSHIDYMYYPVIRRKKKPHITTLHGRLDLPEYIDLYKEFDDIPLVSISKSQRTPVWFANWQGNVYHGLPVNHYKFNPNGGNYLSFIGRISPEKRVDRAIEIAIGANIPIRIAAKVDKADKEYYEAKIKPMLSHPLVEFLGEVGEQEKEQILGNSLGFIYAIDWPEPFGLGMIEAMACGTPVIAYNCGSVPEVVDENITGFIVNSQSEAINAVKKLPQLSRAECRKTFERRFSAKRMVDDYLNLYQKLLETAKSNTSLRIM